TSAGVSTDELAYDTEGRVSDETKTFLTRTGYPMITSYTYDTLNRTATMRLPAQYGLSGSPRKFVYYTYDSSSRLTTLKYGTALNKVQQAGDLVYNAADQTTSINIGPSGANQVNEQYTFDPQTGLLTNQKAVGSSKTLLDLTYDYNRNNSIGTLSGKTGHLTKISNNLDHNKDREYKFDAIGRLTLAKGGVNSALWSQTYTYDRYGNRTSVAATGVAADNTTMPADGIPNLAFNTANNQVTTSNATGQFEYDVAGNQTKALDQDGSTWDLFEYDAANRLVNIKKASDSSLLQMQTFGVGNERIASTDNVINQTTWYGNAVEYTESNGNGTLAWSKTCTYLGDSLLSTITPNGAGGEVTEYNHPDRLGTRLVTNQATGTSLEQAHLPFGKALDAESTLTTNPKRFTSYERSARTQLDYAVNRTYDSKQGRFTQVDPMGMEGVGIAAPQSLNLYSYCGNDPINHLDPNGLFWGKLFHWISKIFKWVMLAVTIAVAILTVVGTFLTPMAMAAFVHTLLGQALTFIAGIPATIGNFVGAVGHALGGIFSFVAEGIPPGVIGSGILVTGSSVGAIANSFAKSIKGDSKNDRLVRAAVNSALWRINSKPDCKKFLQEEFKGDPAKILTDVYNKGQIGKDIPRFHDIGGAVAQSPLNGGSSGHIQLGAPWFDSGVGGWTGTLNSANTRTLILLHEVKHLTGTPHDQVLRDGKINRDDDYFNRGIAKHCFGVDFPPVEEGLPF
ncbi:MAG: RHS repeat-associated core domain-containing protein, partial [Acidobacteriota bacterium]